MGGDRGVVVYAVFNCLDEDGKQRKSEKIETLPCAVEAVPGRSGYSAQFTHSKIKVIPHTVW